MIDALVHYPETSSTRFWIARSAFIDDFLLMLLNHDVVFHGPSYGEHR